MKGDLVPAKFFVVIFILVIWDGLMGKIDE